MKHLVISFILLFFGLARASDLIIDEVPLDTTWSKITKNPEDNVRYLIDFLKKSETGKQLLKAASLKAADAGETLFDVLKAGDGSLTDTTLVRKFSKLNPSEIVYETKSKVFINRDLNVIDAVLDMAHELTHFTFRSPFNPYTYKMSAKDFIVSTIEGSGGEVDAFLMECRVIAELFPRQMHGRSTCRKVQEPGTQYFSKILAISEFYKVGSYWSDYEIELNRFGIKREETEASKESVSFISSAYGVPYPLAAVREYMNVMTKVCENDKKRFAFMQAGIDRSPASTEKLENKIPLISEELRKNHNDRCRF